MSYRPCAEFVLRAPLLPVTGAADAARRLRAHPLGELGIALGSPDLAARLSTPGAARALDRYARRAAFRCTPHGLWSGVMMGHIGAATRISTGRLPRAHLTLSWESAAALARALLAEPAHRTGVRLRQAPSLVRAGDSIRWLAMGDGGAEDRQADCDARLARLLDAASDWTLWPALRAMVNGGDGAHADADDFLLLLLDDGLLLDDLTPPLLGPPPLAWLRERLSTMDAADETAQALTVLETQLRAGDARAAETTRRGCPGAVTDGSSLRSALHAVLVHQPPRPPTLARAAVERAATLAPLLFRLQEALAAPASERLAQSAVGEALTSVVESFGAGALDAGALACGDYGVPFGDDADSDEAPAVVEPPRPLLTFLLDAIVPALASRRATVELSSRKLAVVLGDEGPAPPPTAELFLSPCRAVRGARPGTDWLLGLHAPGGASWGRFAHALTPALPGALRALAAAERAAFPDQETVDVAFAPSPALADLCTHPPARGSALALTSWPAAPTVAVTPAALALCADPAAAVPLSLRHRESRSTMVPAPFGRVRSTTAPAGFWRLLVGWSLFRQHAPWALALGPLADLARLPRICLDGFVISPASWRVPAAVADGTGPTARRALGRWRREAGLPRVVQVGAEDELLPVDLTRPTAADDLRGADRVWEIWPPLDATVDDDGRRVEAVIAVCDQPDNDDERRARADHARLTRAMGEVPPPRRQPAADGWITFKLFAVAAHQDRLVLAAVVPAVAAALAAAEIDAWFFLRYRETPGPRPHLRVRVHGALAGQARFAARLESALGPLRNDGALVSVETAPYFAEGARLGDAAAVAAAHRIYQSDSELVTALLEDLAHNPDDDDQRGDHDALAFLIRSFDALAAGCGLDADARWKLAIERRRAVAGALTRAEVDAEFRVRSRGLRAVLAADDAEASAGAPTPFAVHQRRVVAAVSSLPLDGREALLPTLLHLAAVRLLGPDRDAEARATIFWERTREGLARAR
ncbi:MAG TPA: thiopeptide-type bacteriocin biosynthesis protein [Polyangia bacterium]